MTESGDGEVTLVFRVIRSFAHRNIRNIVMRNMSLEQTGGQLLDRVRATVATSTTLPPPFRKYDYDTLKIEHHAHGAKSNDPVINKEEDDKLILGESKTLEQVGVKHETEISLFKMADYIAYKESGGQVAW